MAVSRFSALFLMLVLAGSLLHDASARETRQVVPRADLFPAEKRAISIFRLASPSVVHINTLALSRRPFSRMVTETPRGSGTGFVWDSDGHIVTNFHVIAGGSGVKVTLSDQTEWPARLVGYFADRDLAVLRIDPEGRSLEPLALGSSASLLVGQHVYAIGNPFGLDQTMTTGIVSALERDIAAGNNRTLRGVIQTDAAINPGNSGGPLLDSAGRLIGVNTAIFSPSGSSVGIGFAIPVDEVNRIVPKLIRDGRFERPVIGIEPAPPGFLRALRLGSGVAVLGVRADSPAARAGLMPFRRGQRGGIVHGDVIVKAADTPVESLDDLYAVLEQYEPGDTVAVQVRRGQAERRLELTLAPSPQAR
ncbi:MAG: S1C family serine protease [Burkholderiaceae bacterium]